MSYWPIHFRETVIFRLMLVRPGTNRRTRFQNSGQGKILPFNFTKYNRGEFSTGLDDQQENGAAAFKIKILVTAASNAQICSRFVQVYNNIWVQRVKYNRKKKN